MSIPDLQTLIQRVVRIFEPGKITLTLFISSSSSEEDEDKSEYGSGDVDVCEDVRGGVKSHDSQPDETAIEVAQRVFKAALMKVPANPPPSPPSPANQGTASTAPLNNPYLQYRRTDKINYEFGGYDLAFASFELKG